MADTTRDEHDVLDPSGKYIGCVWLDCCNTCGALVGARHRCFGEAVAHVEATDFNDVATWGTGEVVTAMAEASEAFTRPLTLVVNTRNGQHFLIDGVKDDTRVSLSSLDDVDKAAIKVLLQQALREIDPPRATGGTVTFGGGALISSSGTQVP